MPDNVIYALQFLVNTVFDLYLFVLAARLVLVYAGANYFDPLTQVIVKLTDFIVKPVRKFIPNVRRFELSTVLLMILIQCVKFFLFILLNYNLIANPLGLVILALADSLNIILLLFTYAIILQVVLTWIQPHSPALKTLMKITAPIMQPLHRVIPPISGIDITPIPALILIQLITILLVNPLIRIGMSIAHG